MSFRRCRTDRLSPREVWPGENNTTAPPEESIAATVNLRKHYTADSSAVVQLGIILNDPTHLLTPDPHDFLFSVDYFHGAFKAQKP